MTDGCGRTHVTGTISALPNQFGFTGVAPEASIGHYRIFGCTGSVSEEVVRSPPFSLLVSRADDV